MNEAKHESRKREANKRYRTKITGEVRDALVKAAGISSECAELAVAAIAARAIPHVTLNW